MTRAILKGGMSLSQRIRAFAPDVSNHVIAAELGAHYPTVVVVRSKQKRQQHYRRKQSAAQRSKRHAEGGKRYAWAIAYANAHPTFEPRRT